MNCTIKTKMLDSASFAFLLKDEFSGKSVYIPQPEAFEYIRFRINKGDRIADAYEQAGEAFTRIVPDANLTPCIKLLYTNFKDQFNEERDRVFRPFGDWVFEEACLCLQTTQINGRIDLGDGFIVPNGEERTCIIDKMFNGAMNLAGALFSCCPDITYPTQQLGFIEDQLRNTSYPFYNVVRNAHTDYKRVNYKADRIVIADGLVVPSSDEIAEIEIGLNSGMNLTQAYFNIANDILPPAIMIKCIEDKIKNTSASWLDIFKSCQGGNKTLYYVIAGALALFLFAKK